MKVVIDDVVFDSNNSRIAVIFEQGDELEDGTRFIIAGPDSVPEEELVSMIERSGLDKEDLYNE